MCIRDSFNAAGGIGENLIFIKEDVKSLSFGDNRIAEADVYKRQGLYFNRTINIVLFKLQDYITKGG